ncbi:MAG: MOSC domain-containing protein [Alphaproteobacteria bacterium]
MGTLIAIARRAKSHAPMEELQSVQISPDTGLDGDFRGRAEGRNVSVLSREGWEAACAHLGKNLPWTFRRANLLVSGVDLKETAGQRLEVGGVLLEITGECDPCGRMEAQEEGLRAALVPDWRGGVVCTVVRGGGVAVGNPVRLTNGEGS